VSDPVRSRAARELAERALVRLVSEYGSVPEFVLLGGLLPDLLCSNSSRRHIGTTDVDVQVNLEIPRRVCEQCPARTCASDGRL